MFGLFHVVNILPFTARNQMPNVDKLIVNVHVSFLGIERRYQVAKEILDTEKKYLSCLRTLKEVRYSVVITPHTLSNLVKMENDKAS